MSIGSFCKKQTDKVTMTFYCVKSVDLSAFFTFVILSVLSMKQTDKMVLALFTCKKGSSRDILVLWYFAQKAKYQLEYQKECCKIKGLRAFLVFWYSGTLFFKKLIVKN